MQVRNLRGTGHKKCVCGSWTNHWDRHAGARGWPKSCAVFGCSNPPQVGGHVKKLGVGDRCEYIVLLCISCNGKHGQVLELGSRVKYAWANRRETCEAGVNQRT